jgi:GT2 family glycosyltransferase
MKLSAILTINNRPPDVSRKVADSFALEGNQPDEMIVVLDRPTTQAEKGAVAAYNGNLGFPVKFVTVEGEPGWKGPGRAWNHGFREATGDLFYCISSEVVQDAGNLDKARALAEDGRTVVFGSCWNSVKKSLVKNAPHGLLCSSEFPRPLGFIVCMPSLKVREIDGFDEKFMDGFWYDDDDFFFRLFRTGVSFTFDDSVNGVHLDHDRADLNCKRGWEMIGINKQNMIRKHGTEKVWEGLALRVSSSDGQTIWTHLNGSGE